MRFDAGLLASHLAINVRIFNFIKQSCCINTGAAYGLLNELGNDDIHQPTTWLEAEVCRQVEGIEFEFVTTT